MNKKLTGSLLMLAGLAAAAWWAWKRGLFAGLFSSAPAAADPLLSASQLPNLEQVGSNFQEDVTVDVVREFVESFERQGRGCWIWTQSHPNGNRYYENATTGQKSWFNIGEFPINICGREP